ncbi:MAG: DUF2062 domain-containing protein [Pseudomonadota bacterium]
MPRKFIKRWMPEAHTITGHRHLRFFGDLLADPNLFHLNRRSVAGAVALGLFIAFIPMPFQMIAAAAVAILIRVNLPIAVVMVWVSNPLTLPPLLVTGYRLGKWVLRDPTQLGRFEPTLTWLFQEFGLIWPPLLIGSLIMSLVASVTGYFLVHFIWRLNVAQKLRLRRARSINAIRQSKEEPEDTD